MVELIDDLDRVQRQHKDRIEMLRESHNFTVDELDHVWNKLDEIVTQHNGLIGAIEQNVNSLIAGHNRLIDTMARRINRMGDLHDALDARVLTLEFRRPWWKFWA
jgi:hypothetical protein